MSAALQCDICGSFYTKEATGFGRIRGCGVAEIVIRTKTTGVIEKLDLCPKCSQEFVLFINKTRKGE